MHIIVNDDAPPEGQEEDDDTDDGGEEYDDDNDEDLTEGEPDANGETEKVKHAKNCGVCWKTKEDEFLAESWKIVSGSAITTHGGKKRDFVLDPFTLPPIFLLASLLNDE